MTASGRAGRDARAWLWAGVLALLPVGCQRDLPLQFEERAPQPIARFESGAAVVGGRLYVMGGHAGTDLHATREVFSYHLASDSWQRHADMPSPVTHWNAAVQEERWIWVVGGYEGDHPGHAVRASWRYDTLRDAWQEGPPLPELRASGGLAQLGGRLHYFGGLGADRSTNHADHWVHELRPGEQDPAFGGWEPLAPLPVPRAHFAVAVLDGFVYAIGGQLHHDVPEVGGEDMDFSDQRVVHRYDPTADAWEEVAPLPARRSHTESAAAVHDGTILLAGGRNNAPSWPERIARGFSTRIRGERWVTRYDPARDAWTRVGRLPVELYTPAGGVVDGTYVVTGGGVDGWRQPTDLTLVAPLR